MRKVTGILCMILGATLILGALSLFLHNQKEAAEAGAASRDLLPQLIDVIKDSENSPTEPLTYEQPDSTPVIYLDENALKMTTVQIGGYDYIGYLSIPKLKLELPVMDDWDYERLRIAPCRYTGSVRGEDLVILAHNYMIHFGTISKLEPGDSVVFTDMDGVVTAYQVVGQDILDPYAVDEMIAGDFDLTLFTCTFGGKSRVTVYCDRV